MNLKKQWAFNESFPLNFSPIFIPDLRSWIVRLDTTFSCFEMPILQQNLHLFPFDRYRTEKSPIDYFQKKLNLCLNHIKLFFFHSPNATMKILFENFWLRIKSLKWKKVRKSHLLFCLQRRCLLASIDQKTKTRGLTIV